MVKRISSLVGRGHEHDQVAGQETNYIASEGPSPTDDDMYDMFLNLKTGFQHADLRLDYVSFKRSDGHVPLQIFILCMLCMYIGTRFWFAHDVAVYASNPTALVAICLAAATSLMAMATVFLKLCLTISVCCSGFVPPLCTSTSRNSANVWMMALSLVLR